MNRLRILRHGRGSFCSGAAIAVLITTQLTTGSAAADDVTQCVEAHEKAQEARKEGRLLEAKERLLICARDECPAVLRKECGPWLTEVSSSIPTVVIAAKGPGGAELIDVRVSVGERELATSLDGRAIEVDPGVQTFRFETAGQEAIDKEVVVREGVKNQTIQVQFGPVAVEAPKPAPVTPDLPPDADVSESRPIPTLVYVLGGVGAASLLASAYFEASGLSKRGDLDDQGCKPYCPKDDVDAAKRDILIGDIALGVGIASLGAATYFYMTRPSVPMESAQPPVDLRGVRGGAMATYRMSF